MKKITILYTILVVIILSGCIRDGAEECYTTLYFSYKGDGEQEIFPEKIGKVNLYIYNDDGNLVQKLILEKEQSVTISLPNGKYHIICWGNPYTDTQIEDETDPKSGYLAAPNYFLKDVITTNDSLYYGSRDIDFMQDENRVDTVRFSSSHIKMLIELTGLEDLRLPDNSSPVKIVMTNLSPTVDFSKSFSTEKVSYYPLSLFNGDTNNFDSKFNVLRFNDENDIHINIINKETNNIIYSLPLEDFMKENRITVDNKNEVLIGIRFRFNGTSVTVKPWDEETITPGM